jgi:hypothetical protein
MRFMVIARPMAPLPPEMAPALLQGFSAWWKKYADRWRGGFFAGGGGGGGVCDMTDEIEFNQMMMEWPLTPFSNLECNVMIDVDTALGQWQTAFSAMMGPGGAPSQ